MSSPLQQAVRLELSPTEGWVLLVEEGRRHPINYSDLALLDTASHDGATSDAADRLRELGVLREPTAEPHSNWPIFLVGCHRSGSTLLRYLLDSHDNLACPPESKFIAAVQEFMDYPQALTALDSLGYSGKEVLLEIRRFVEAFLGGFAARQNKPRWVDKTPNYYRILPFLNEVFAHEVLFLFIVRHPLDSISSLENYLALYANSDDPEIASVARRWGKGRYAWARYWVEVYEHIRTFAASASDRSHWVRYEDLVLRTDHTVSQILAFLGEPDQPLSTKAFARPHQEGYQDTKILRTRGVHKRSVNRWTSWPQDEVMALWDVVGTLATRFGYDKVRIGPGGGYVRDSSTEPRGA